MLLIRNLMYTSTLYYFKISRSGAMEATNACLYTILADTQFSWLTMILLNSSPGSYNTPRSHLPHRWRKLCHTRPTSPHTHVALLIRLGSLRLARSRGTRKSDWVNYPRTHDNGLASYAALPNVEITHFNIDNAADNRHRSDCRARPYWNTCVGHHNTGKHVECLPDLQHSKSARVQQWKQSVQAIAGEILQCPHSSCAYTFTDFSYSEGYNLVAVGTELHETL
jgi:hypothetical protein